MFFCIFITIFLNHHGLIILTVIILIINFSISILFVLRGEKVSREVSAKRCVLSLISN